MTLSIINTCFLIIQICSASLIVPETFALADEGYEIVTTYIFGDLDDVETLNLRSTESSGFIQLSFDGVGLGINYVRRPTRWNQEHRFCSSILPAAIHDFMERKLHMEVEKIDNISVYNMADKPKVACKCYIGLMINMGFNIINGRTIHEHHSFCERMPTFGLLISGTKSLNAKLPDFNFLADVIVRLARSYTQIQPIGGLD
jgi:hypothetical protein